MSWARGLCDYHPARNLRPDKPKFSGLKYFKNQAIICFVFIQLLFCVGEKQPILQCPNLSHLCPFHGKYLSSSPVGVGWVLHWEGNAAECRLGAAGGRWDHDGPALECPMSQCAMDQSSGRLFCLLCPDTTVDKHASASMVSMVSIHLKRGR